jgi:hypothetical protein
VDESPEPEWHAFTVDGEAFHWRTYPSKQQTNDGPRQRCELLEVARAPNVPGVGTSYAAGTVVREEDAVALVGLFKSHGRPIP